MAKKIIAAAAFTVGIFILGIYAGRYSAIYSAELISDNGTEYVIQFDGAGAHSYSR